MKHKKISYRVYEWLGEECIKMLDDLIDKGLIDTVGDCIDYMNGYCDTSGCVPIEVIEHISKLMSEGKIA